MAPHSAETLIEALNYHVTQHGSRRHILLWRGEDDEQSITYAELDRAARSVGRGLLEKGLTPGDRVAIMLPTEAAFFEAFFGVIYAGGVPGPDLSAISPRSGRGSSAATGRHPAQCRREHTYYRVGNSQSGLIPFWADERSSTRRDGDSVGGGRGSGGTTTGRPRHCRPHAVHIRQHRRPEGRGAHACQPARQHPRDGRSARSELVRRLRQLAAPLSRYGADRRLAWHTLLRRTDHHYATARISCGSRPLAARDGPPSCYAFGRPQFRVRALLQERA